MAEKEGKFDAMLLHIAQQHTEGIEEVSSTMTLNGYWICLHVYVCAWMGYSNCFMYKTVVAPSNLSIIYQ